MKGLIFLLLISFTGSLIAQQDSIIVDDDPFEEILEDFENEDENAVDDLEDYFTNPIDLNTATVDQLVTLPLFDITTANIIVAHRKRFGYFNSAYELRLVADLPPELVRKIIPLFYVSEWKVKLYEPTFLESLLGKTKLEYRSRFQSDIQNRKGFTENKYEGDKLKSYQRAGIKLGSNIKSGFLIEKDAGEKSYNDFTSFYAEYSSKDIIEKVIVGDYLVEFGQGLTIWSPYAFSKGAEVVSPLFRKEKNIRAYRSTDENQFRRGAAIALNYSDFRFTLFYSKNYFDANIDSLSNTFLSRPIDGYHRTVTEIRREDSGNELLMGTRIDYSVLSNLKINLLYLNAKFNSQMVKSKNVYDAAGDNFQYSAMAYSYYLNNFFATGELSYNNIAVASISNIQFKLAKNFVFVASLRNYPRNYYSLYGIGFAEQSSRTQNEIGIYTGFRYNSPIGVINFFYDQFRFPSSTTDIPFPSNGNEILVDLRRSWSRTIVTHSRYRREVKDVMTTNNGFKEIVDRTKQNFRNEIIVKPSRDLRLRTRAELVYVSLGLNFSNEKGYLLFQDAKWNVTRYLSLSGRLIFFKTDSYNSAVYEYENDLPGIMSNLAMYDEGMRWYLIISYNVIKNLKLGIKYAETYKPGKVKLSSGNSEILGNVDNRFNLQLDMNF